MVREKTAMGGTLWGALQQAPPLRLSSNIRAKVKTEVKGEDRMRGDTSDSVSQASAPWRKGIWTHLAVLSLRVLRGPSGDRD